MKKIIALMTLMGFSAFSQAATFTVESSSFIIQLDNKCHSDDFLDITPCIATYKSTNKKTGQTLILNGIATFHPGGAIIDHTTYVFTNKQYAYILTVNEEITDGSTLWVLQNGKKILEQKLKIKY